MITFKRFIQEAAAEAGVEPKYERIDSDSLIETIKKYCSDAMWMVEKNKPFWRGDGSVMRQIEDERMMMVDTSATMRMSENTSNYYTVILDGHPGYSKFPKRSRSFIAATNEHVAFGYAEKAYALIPFNGTKIGVVGSPDIWDLRVKLFGESLLIEHANSVFQRLDIIPTVAGFKAFAKKLKSGDHEAIIAVRKAVATLNRSALNRDKHLSLEELDERINPIVNDFWGHILEVYSPAALKLTAATTATISHDIAVSEVWVGGKCLCISSAEWADLVERSK